MIRKDGATAIVVVRVVVELLRGEKVGFVIRWYPYEMTMIPPRSARMIAATTSVVRATRIEMPR
jgi:hypothetical protein